MSFFIQISPQYSRNESGVLKLFQHTHIGKQKALTSMTKGALLTSLFSSRQNTPSRISLESWSKCYLRKLVKELPFIYIMCVCVRESRVNLMFEKEILEPKHLHFYNNLDSEFWRVNFLTFYLYCCQSILPSIYVLQFVS